MPCGSWDGVAKCRPTRMNRLMLPCAQVCQRARAKAVAASVAIRAAAAGRFVLDASEPDGGAPVPAPGALLVAGGGTGRLVFRAVRHD